ncbi:MAG: FtsX-like permease family protein, partial [Vicinamibacteria bacterium]
RTQEIGLRMALGARPRDVVRLIVSQNSLALAHGFAIGGLGALGIGRWLASTFEEVGSIDPRAFAATASILAIVATLATWLPARRAATVDPATALRDQ